MLTSFIDNTRGILEAVLNMALFKKSKYMALASLAKCAELAPVLLDMEPNLGQELLQVAKDPSLFNQVPLPLIFFNFSIFLISLSINQSQSKVIRKFS